MSRRELRNTRWENFEYSLAPRAGFLWARAWAILGWTFCARWGLPMLAANDWWELGPANANDVCVSPGRTKLKEVCCSGLPITFVGFTPAWIGSSAMTRQYTALRITTYFCKSQFPYLKFTMIISKKDKSLEIYSRYVKKPMSWNGSGRVLFYICSRNFFSFFLRNSLIL